MYACMYVCLSVCVCMHVYMYSCTFVRVYACMYICIYIYMYVCVYVCMYVRMFFVIVLVARFPIQVSSKLQLALSSVDPQACSKLHTKELEFISFATDNPAILNLYFICTFPWCHPLVKLGVGSFQSTSTKPEVVPISCRVDRVLDACLIIQI